MSAVDVQLSRSGDDEAIFHDFRYTNDHESGNSNALMFEVENLSGNDIFVEYCVREQNEHGVWENNWYDAGRGQGLDAVRIHITGGIESSEFLRMLHLILETEKMVSIIKP